jgi:hypothetical protein
MIATVEVRAAIRIPVGETLDGAVLEESQVVASGSHTISHALMVENEWGQTGRVELVAVDGQTVHWGACCGGHE